MYKRVGGAATVKRIVAEYHAGLRGVPYFSSRFENTDMEELADRHRRFLTWVLDGPAAFDSAEDRRRVAERRLPPEAFDGAMSVLRSVLDRHLGASADIEHVMRAVQRREPLLVNPDDEDG
ncbi:MAG: hypothetical protein TEF_12930 [Rhizobiales bacterium NRL2]|jgi:truncated hemoglobin YjbI|nr:MAG: hypothetical protein TEF_12930 [Rhizobiales bacterium NRL2]